MITVIAGTNRPNSQTKLLCEIYQTRLKELELPSTLLDLQLLPPDFYFTSLNGKAKENQDFTNLLNVFSQSDKYIFLVPEYNGSFPGVLKTFLDALPYPNPVSDKKIALVGLGEGNMGGTLALSHLTDIFNYLGANVLSFRVRMPFIHKHLVDNVLSDEYKSLIDKQIQKFIAF